MGGCGQHGLRGRHRVRRRGRQQFLGGRISISRAIDRLSRSLPARDRRLRRDGGSPSVLRPAVQDDAGQLGTGQQDGDGDVGVHAQHQLGQDRLPQHRRHGRPGHVIGDAASRGGGGVVPAASWRRPLQRGEVSRALDVRRGRAARALQQGRQERRRRQSRKTRQRHPPGISGAGAQSASRGDAAKDGGRQRVLPVAARPHRHRHRAGAG